MPEPRQLLDLDDGELEALDLPARPLRLDSSFGRAWQALLQDLTTADVQDMSLLSPGSPRMAALLSAASRYQTSTNWSGGMILPRGQRFRRVAAEWHVPQTFVRPADVSTLTPDCTIWIGFGGHRLWSGALPQIGTRHRMLSSGQMLHYAWIQWWVRKGPNEEELPIDSIDVEAGDHIVALAELRPDGKVLFVIRNRTPPRQAFYRFVYPQPPGVGSAAKGVSAQWIVERPRNPAEQTFHPLVNYGEAVFLNCGAETASTQRSLAAARLIRMVRRASGARLKMRVSEPRLRDQPEGQLLVRFDG